MQVADLDGISVMLENREGSPYIVRLLDAFMNELRRLDQTYPGEIPAALIRYLTDRMRGGADARGYDARWRKARKVFLEQHPLCAECVREGKLTPATVVDHIVPHRGDKALFWNEKTGSPFAWTAMIEKTGKVYDQLKSQSRESG